MLHFPEDKELKQIRKAKTAVWTTCPGRLVLGAVGLAFSVCAAGCVKQTDTSEKLRDLKFTVLEKEAVPDELGEVIEEEKEEPFKLSYTDQGVLYLAEGYGGSLRQGTVWR